MSQHDFEITKEDANTGATFRAAINIALQALVSNNSGEFEPATPYGGMWWVSIADGIVKQRNVANDAWIDKFSVDDTLATADSVAILTSAINFVGLWVDQTGPLDVPASVYHLDKQWQLLSDLVDVTLSEPGTDPEWVDLSLGSAIHAAISKPIPVDLDELALVDSEDSFALKRISFSKLTSAVGEQVRGVIEAAGVPTTGSLDDGQWYFDTVTGIPYVGTLTGHRFGPAWSFTSASEPVPMKLIAWYLGSVFGNERLDEKSSLYHMTLSHSHCLTFDAVNDVVFTQVLGPIDNVYKLSATAELGLCAAGTTGSIIGGGTSVSIRWNQDEGRLYFFTESSGDVSSIEASYVIAPGIYQIAGHLDVANRTIKLYVDEALVADGTYTSGTTPDIPTVTNMNNLNATKNFEGRVWDVKIGDTLYPLAEGSGSLVLNTTGTERGTISSTTLWGSFQDDFHHNVVNGFWASDGAKYPNSNTLLHESVIAPNLVPNAQVNTTPPPVINSALDFDDVMAAWTWEEGSTDFCQQNIAFDTGTTAITYSLYCRVLGPGAKFLPVTLGINGGERCGASAEFDFDTGVVIACDNLRYENLGSGLWRISRTFYDDGTGSLFILRIDPSTNLAIGSQQLTYETHDTLQISRDSADNSVMVNKKEHIIDITCWGDSISLDYPTYLKDMNPQSALYGRGIGGETSTEILARFNLETERHDDITVIWAGNNNDEEQAIILADIASMVSSLSHDRYLILSLLNKDEEAFWSGGVGYNRILAINEALSSVYGSNYLNIRAHLVSLYDPNIPQDVIDHDHDVYPSSLRVDPIHPNSAGSEAIAEKILDVLETTGTFVFADAATSQPADTWNGAETLNSAPEEAELIAADLLGDGPFLFDAGGNSVPRAQDEFISFAETSNSLFMCIRDGKYELRKYSEELVGQELIEANGWCED